MGQAAAADSAEQSVQKASVFGCDSLLIFLRVRNLRYRLISETNQRLVAVMLEMDPCTLTCPNCGADLQPAVHRFVSFKDLFRLKCSSADWMSLATRFFNFLTSLSISSGNSDQGNRHTTYCCYLLQSSS